MMCHLVLSLQNQPAELGVKRCFDMILKYLDVISSEKEKKTERLVQVCNLILLGLFFYLLLSVTWDWDDITKPFQSTRRA